MSAAAGLEEPRLLPAVAVLLRSLQCTLELLRLFIMWLEKSGAQNGLGV